MNITISNKNKNPLKTNNYTEKSHNERRKEEKQMSTISIDKKKLNSFNGVIEKVINSAEGLEGRLEGIRSILQGVKDSNTDLQNTVEDISSSSKTESEKIEELQKISKQVD